MSLVLADTSGWYAALIPSDPDHDAARRWLATNEADHLVTDFIVDELLTLLRIRNANRRAIEIGSDFFQGTLAQIEWVTPADVVQGWEVFCAFEDKGWSFTDCVSRAVMGRLSIQRAYAFDKHFRQFGTLTVVP